MGRLSGGADIDLAKAPLKYQGLQPWEILLSEAQERMTLAVAPEQERAFMALAERMDVEATTIGEFTDSGAFVIRYAEKVVGRLDMDFLYDGAPRMELKAVWQPKKLLEPAAIPAKHLNNVLLELLAELNICSKEYKSRQYDGEVKGLSVVKPFVGLYCDMPSDATVMRVEYESNQGVVLAEGINPFYSDLDTYNMAASVIDEAVRRIVSAGGDFDRIAGIDNFCWPDPVQSDKTPDGELKLAQLVRACKALYDITTAYKVPCISGKDSMKNDSTRGGKKISIPPTLLFSTIGIIDDVRNAITMDVKQPYDVVYVVGLTKKETGASVFNRYVAKSCGVENNFGGELPGVDVALSRCIYQAMNKANKLGLIRSSHTPTKGGLAIAFALTALGGDLGMEIWLNRVPVEGSLNELDILFSESNGRFVVTVSPENAVQFENVFSGLPCAEVGNVMEERKLRILTQAASTIIETELPEMRKAFTETLKGV
jgi:phosphoribosylformylglycinamidine synthase